MTAFATHPGAFSRESISAAVRNGFFTGALISRLRSQGKTTDVRQLMGCVRDDVLEATGGRQQPYTAGSLHGDLCLVVPSNELEPVRPACVLRFRAPGCTAFSDPLFSFQTAIGFRASIVAGNLEALLRHLSSGESPTQSFVCIDNRALAHVDAVPSPLLGFSYMPVGGRARKYVIRLAPRISRFAQANSWTPIHFAGYYGQAGCAQALLGRGANVNQTLVRLTSPCVDTI
jgi:hypothetical protein